MQSIIHRFPFPLSSLSPAYTHQPLRYVVARLLRSNKLQVDADVLEQRLSGHPYFPSLLSVSEVLHELGIGHRAYRTGIDRLLHDFTRPVLVFLSLRGGMFGVVEGIQDGKIILFTEHAEKKAYPVEEFVRAWDGVVLELDPAGSRKVKQEKRQDTYPFYLHFALVAGWMVVAAYLFTTFAVLNSPSQTILLLLSLAGTGFSWLLVLQHLDKQNVLTKQLCNSSTSKGCSSVLSSRSALLTRWLSMAEAGLLYFAGGTLLLLFYETPVLYFCLALLVPVFSLYAIYLQAVVLRTWCRLCMAVHGVLLAGFAVAAGHMVLFPFRFGFPPMGQAVLFVLPALLWLGGKPFIRKLKEGAQYKHAYRRLKADPELFVTLLKKQPKVHIPEELKVFRFGSTSAGPELVFVSNPFCGPCAQAHRLLHAWLESGVDFRITILFVHKADPQDPKHQFAEFLSGMEDLDALEKAVHAWFGEDQTDLQTWARRCGTEKKALGYEAEKLQHWLEVTGVQATPTFFINDYKLPSAYRLEEIRYLISELT
jgi:uncharacterized membrane protein